MGYEIICQDGLMYTKRDKSAIKISWRCKNRNCRGKILTPIEYSCLDRNINFKEKGSHSCNLKFYNYHLHL